MNPAPMISAPDTYTGTAVARFPYSAMTGAYNAVSVAKPNESRGTHKYTKDTGRCRREAVASPAVFRGEQLRRHSVEDAVHDLRRVMSLGAHPERREEYVRYWQKHICVQEIRTDA